MQEIAAQVLPALAAEGAASDFVGQPQHFSECKIRASFPRQPV